MSVTTPAAEQTPTGARDAAAITHAPGGTAVAARGGPGAPVGSRAGRRTSRDPDDFGRPTGREEEWRFTPLRRLEALLDPADGSGEVVYDVTASDQVTHGLVGVEDEAVGAVLTPQDRVSALAWRQTGQALLVRVPAEQVVAEPVVITARAAADATVSDGHVVLDVGAFAAVTVIIDRTGGGAVAGNLEARLGDGARLDLVVVHDQEPSAVHVEAQAVLVGRDATLRHTVVTLGGDLIRLTPTVRYAGPGGDADLAGMYLTSAGQHHEHQLYVDHEAPQCRSRVDYRGALQGADAHSVWVGDVLIGAPAEGTDTYETNRNLVLTDGARADSVPNLEIETGEVTGAGHASATGRFDDEQLFYCMARGIPADEARRLVVRGFFAEVLARIPLESLRDRLGARVDALLDEAVRAGAA